MSGRNLTIAFNHRVASWSQEWVSAFLNQPLGLMEDGVGVKGKWGGRDVKGTLVSSGGGGGEGGSE